MPLEEYSGKDDRFKEKNFLFSFREKYQSYSSLENNI
jgi:hypothetical protein